MLPPAFGHTQAEEDRVHPESREGEGRFAVAAVRAHRMRARVVGYPLHPHQFEREDARVDLDGEYAAALDEG